MRNRVIASISVAAAVAVSGVGGALIAVPSLSGAQPFSNAATLIAATDANKAATTPGPAHSSPLIDAAAKALNLTTAQLVAKLADGKTTIADVAKQQNVDINTVIAAMVTADKDRITKIVNTPAPHWAGGPGGPFAGRGPGMFGGFGRFGAMALDPVAKALGITTDQLRTDLANGQTIAQIAKSKNVDVNTIINSLVTAGSTKIDQAVKAGRLQQAQADKVKAALKTEITNLVNNGFPKGPRGGFGFGSPGHMHFGGGAPDSAPQPAPTS